MGIHGFQAFTAPTESKMKNQSGLVPPVVVRGRVNAFWIPGFILEQKKQMSQLIAKLCKIPESQGRIFTH